MQIESGTVVGEATCPSCGEKKPLKVNVAGGVYFNCQTVTGTLPNGKKERCCTRLNLGKLGSRNMIAKHLSEGLSEKESVTHESAPRIDPENPAPEPAGELKQPAGGAGDAGGGGAARHWLDSIL